MSAAFERLVPVLPPNFFSPAREKTAPAGACRRPTAASRRRQTGRSRSKRKERFVSLVENFRRVEPKREVQIDLPLRRIPLPLLRRVGWLVFFLFNHDFLRNVEKILYSNCKNLPAVCREILRSLSALQLLAEQPVAVAVPIQHTASSGKESCLTRTFRIELA